MIIKTSRFGDVGVESSDIVEFVEGMLGFPNLKKFVFLDDPNDTIFAWLQSCEDGGVAFPILEPELFHETYKITLTVQETQELSLPNLNEARLYTIVTIPDDPTQMSANLKAPIVLNPKRRLAKQCVLADNSLAIREPIFSKLQQRLVHNKTSFRKATENMDCVVMVGGASNPSSLNQPRPVE